ncbi:MAG: PP2C family protein-serine/threonine phosphatase [Planctomycetota bacterium]|nr:PP2C family protein-serine/threonine phosphatase [Planctomycetota bacterium]
MPRRDEDPSAPQLLPWEDLRHQIVVLRMERLPIYKVTNAEGIWVCPYCLDITDALLKNWDDSEVKFDWFLPQALKHLKDCKAYQRAPLSPHPIEVVAGALGKKDIRQELLKRVLSEPIFRVCDDAGNWIDPFGECLVDDINLVRVPWGAAIQEAIVDYLLSPTCPGANTRWQTSRTVEDLNRLAGRLSAERSTRSIAERTATQEVELDILRHRVLELNVTAETVQEIQKDLDGAREVQRKMLPTKSPAIPGYEVSWVYDPCTTVGGDFFSFLEIGAGQWGFLIADVSGHGVEAAMIMSMALKSFSVRGAGQTSPAEVLKAVNRDVIPDMAQGKFITAFYMILEAGTGRLRYARAGHNPVLLTEFEKGTIRSLEGQGIPIGVGRPEIFDSRLQEQELLVPPQSLLLMYTDGIPEAANEKREQFGNMRLSQSLMRTAGQPSKNVIEELVRDVRRHIGALPMDDDLTLVALRRLGE